MQNTKKCCGWINVKIAAMKRYKILKLGAEGRKLLILNCWCITAVKAIDVKLLLHYGKISVEK